MSNKVLVTGNRGYIGSHAQKKLEELGYDVFGLDLQDSLDIRNPDCYPKGYDIDYVLHFAANPSVQYSVENPEKSLHNNVYGTSVLLRWARDNNVKRVVFSSSAAVYGNGDNNPTSPYGMQKRMSEMQCKLYSQSGLDTVSLRYFNVFSDDQPFGGAYSTAICAWKHLLEQGLPLRIDGDGTQTRDFIHVSDIVDANIHFMLCSENLRGNFYDIGAGTSTSLNEIKELIDRHHSTVQWSHAPERVGDIKHSVSNPVSAWEMGWMAKQNPIEAIADIFEKTNA
jgi:UDP-glucose 4-epimerase